jgi:hypothetical protein
MDLWITEATTGLLYQSRVMMVADSACRATGGILGRGKPASVPSCPPQIPHEPESGSNPNRRGEKPATNLLSYGTAIIALMKGRRARREA